MPGTGTGGGAPRVDPPPVSAPSAVPGMWQSTRQTGNGTEQTIAHTLGVVPRSVVIQVEGLPSLPDIASSGVTLATPGTHTSAAVKVTALANVLYRVTAFA